MCINWRHEFTIAIYCIALSFSLLSRSNGQQYSEHAYTSSENVDKTFSRDHCLEVLISQPRKFMHRRLHALFKNSNSKQTVLMQLIDNKSVVWYQWMDGWFAEVNKNSSEIDSLLLTNSSVLTAAASEIGYFIRLIDSSYLQTQEDDSMALNLAPISRKRLGMFSHQRQLLADSKKISLVKSRDKLKRDVYLLDGDTKYFINGMDTLTQLGYSIADVADMDDEALDRLQTGDTLSYETMSLEMKKKFGRVVLKIPPPATAHGPADIISNISDAELNDIWTSFVESHSVHKSAQSTRNYKIYVAIFAGRHQYMTLTLKYLDILLEEKLIDEVHIWDFVPTDEQDKCVDSAFLENYVRNTEVPGYVLFKRSRFDYKRNMNNVNEGYLWGSYYSHYLRNRRYKKNDIFIKCDDDVVFIDVAHFHRFTDGIASRKYNHSLYFPNIINNDAGFAIQAKRLDSPTLQFYYNHYELQGVNFDERLNSFYQAPELGWKQGGWTQEDSLLVIPITDWYYGTYASGDFAADIHNLFLQNPSRFIARSRGSHSNSSRYVPLSRRISINMFGATFDVIRDVFHQFLNVYCCDDEGFVGLWPTLSGFKHVIDTGFTISHMSFNSQKEAKDLSLQTKRYNRLADIFVKSFSITRTPDFEEKLLSYNPLLSEGSLIRIDSWKPAGRTIYLITSCQRRPFASMDALTNRGYDIKHVIALPSEFVLSIPVGKEIE